MRTSKNVPVCREGGGGFFYLSALLCLQQEILSLAANGCDANQLQEQERLRIGGKNREIESKMSKTAGSVNA